MQGAGPGGGHKKEYPAPCSEPAAPTPHPWVCAWACSGFRVLLPLGLAGGAMAEGQRSPCLDGGGGGAGARAGGPRPGRRQGTTGRLAIEGQEKVGVWLRLGPGRIRGSEPGPGAAGATVQGVGTAGRGAVR